MAHKLDLLNFLRTGQVPKNFHHYATGYGNLGEYCVFCKEPVDPSIASDHGYSIALFGRAPVPVDRNTTTLVDTEIECTICINCSNDISDAEEEPSDTMENLEIYIKTGKYPHNIIEFSLSDSADHYCALCRVDLDMYPDDCVAHTIPPGYTRNMIEKDLIPRVVFICGACNDAIHDATINGHFTGKLNYTRAVCSDCSEIHPITQAEYEHRVETKQAYLCHTCAQERGLKGYERMLERTCQECGEKERVDMLIEENAINLHGVYVCNSCKNTNTEFYRSYVGTNLCVEVYSMNNNTWTYVIFMAQSVNEDDDQIMHSSSREWKESWIATFVGTLKAIEIANKQLELPFYERDDNK